jgi:hypothetical protein
MRVFVGSRDVWWVCRELVVFKFEKLGRGFGLGFDGELMCSK